MPERAQERVEGDACREQRNLVGLGLFPAAFDYLFPATCRNLMGRSALPPGTSRCCCVVVIVVPSRMHCLGSLLPRA